MSMPVIAPGDTHTMTLPKPGLDGTGGFSEADFRRNVQMAFPNYAQVNGVVFGEITYDDMVAPDGTPLWRAQATAAPGG